MSVRKCVLGDENDIDVVNHNDDVTRSHDTSLGNIEIVTDDKEAFSALTSVQCFDTVGWAAKRASGL